MFYVSVTTPNMGRPMIRSFSEKETAEQYILNVIQGLASKNSEEFSKRVEAEKDNISILMALLEEIDVSVVYWEI